MRWLAHWAANNNVAKAHRDNRLDLGTVLETNIIIRKECARQLTNNAHRRPPIIRCVHEREHYRTDTTLLLWNHPFGEGG